MFVSIQKLHIETGSFINLLVLRILCLKSDKFFGSHNLVSHQVESCEFALSNTFSMRITEFPV